MADQEQARRHYRHPRAEIQVDASLSNGPAVGLRMGNPNRTQASRPQLSSVSPHKGKSRYQMCLPECMDPTQLGQVTCGFLRWAQRTGHVKCSAGTRHAQAHAPRARTATHRYGTAVTTVLRRNSAQVRAVRSSRHTEQPHRQRCIQRGLCDVWQGGEPQDGRRHPLQVFQVQPKPSPRQNHHQGHAADGGRPGTGHDEGVVPEGLADVAQCKTCQATRGGEHSLVGLLTIGASLPGQTCQNPPKSLFQPPVTGFGSRVLNTESGLFFIHQDD